MFVCVFTCLFTGSCLGHSWAEEFMKDQPATGVLGLSHVCACMCVVCAYVFVWCVLACCVCMCVCMRVYVCVHDGQCSTVCDC